MNRREWLKQAGFGSLAALPVVMLVDAQALVTDAVNDIVGSENVKPDSRVELLVKEDAANGAVVPVGVFSNVPHTKRIILLVDNHDQGKVMELDTSHAMIAPRLSTHLQLTSPTTITALIEAGSGWHMNTAQVKTLGESCEQ